MQEISIPGEVTSISPVIIGPESNASNAQFEACEHSVVTPSEQIDDQNRKMPQQQDLAFPLDAAQPIDPRSFPNPPQNSKFVRDTIPNIDHLLKSYGITVQYDIIKKKLRIAIPGNSGSLDNMDNVAMSHILSLANLNGIPTGLIPGFVETIGDRYQLNPVATWVMSKPWDGVDRVQALCDTLTQRDGFPEALKRTLLHKWLIGAIAAAFEPNGCRVRGVLTLQGPQSSGKTEFVKSLVSDPLLRESVVKLDHHLDPGNKDSLISAVCHWIVEVGELDSSLKKDVARLKGFLTSNQDKVRRPYARTESEYGRRTVFIATVNDSQFLVDPTGNTRWWTIPVVKIDFKHNIDMQQLFAQIKCDYSGGLQWWLTSDEEALLEQHNLEHRTVSVIRERLTDEFDLTRIDAPNLPAMTPSELLRAIGMTNPSNSQCKECGAVLREFLGEPKKIQGSYKWRVPLKLTEWEKKAALSVKKAR